MIAPVAQAASVQRLVSLRLQQPLITGLFACAHNEGIYNGVASDAATDEAYPLSVPGVAYRTPRITFRTQSEHRAGSGIQRCQFDIAPFATGNAFVARPNVKAHRQTRHRTRPAMTALQSRRVCPVQRLVRPRRRGRDSTPAMPVRFGKFTTAITRTGATSFWQFCPTVTEKPFGPLLFPPLGRPATSLSAAGPSSLRAKRGLTCNRLQSLQSITLLHFSPSDSCLKYRLPIIK